MNQFIPIPEPFWSTLEMGDRENLILISQVGVFALGLILYLRWYRKPMSASYWMAASLPFIVGTLRGLYQYDWVIYSIGENGISGPGHFWPDQQMDEGLLTIHYGVLLSAILYALNLFLHGWDLFRFRLKSPITAQSS